MNNVNPCFGYKPNDKYANNCSVMSIKSKYCGTNKCPFFKPNRYSIRHEDSSGNITFEERK